MHGLPFLLFFYCDLANSPAGNVFLHFVQTITVCEDPLLFFASDVSCIQTNKRGLVLLKV